VEIGIGDLRFTHSSSTTSSLVLRDQDLRLEAHSFVVVCDDVVVRDDNEKLVKPLSHRQSNQGSGSPSNGLLGLYKVPKRPPKEVVSIEH